MSAADASSPARSADRPTETRAVALALGGLLSLALALGIGRFVYTPILPVMSSALGLTRTQGGLLASANLLGYLLGALAAAAPRGVSPRRALFLALGVCAVTTGGMALVSSMPAFLVLRFVGGVASALAFVFATALVLDGVAAAGRAGLAALHFAGVGTGIAVSALLVAGLAAVGADWRWLWGVCGIVSAVAALAVARLLTAPPASPRAMSSAALPPRVERRRGNLPCLVIAYGLFGFGYVITATFLLAIVRETAALRAMEPVVWIVVGLAAAPSVALWLAVERRIGLRATFALALLAEATGVTLSVVGGGGAAIIVSGALLGATFVGITALGLVGARRLAGGNPARALGLMTAAFGLGQVIGPSFAGVLSDRTHSFLAPSLAAAGALVLAAVLGAISGPGVETPRPVAAA